jgi:anaerobic dimethyl sulfoxide reductase subunit B
MNRRLSFVLILGRCVGCGACVLGCRLENDWPSGVRWRRVLPLNLDRWAGGPTYHFSLACHHCEHPACLEACPSGVYVKRQDGIVQMEPDRCLGCRYCEMACPFEAPSYDADAGTMTKCHFCAPRIDAGLPPACVAACPTGALDYRMIEGEAETEPIPGFRDVSGCRPNIRLVEPGGALRRKRLRELQEELSL